MFGAAGRARRFIPGTCKPFGFSPLTYRELSCFSHGSVETVDSGPGGMSTPTGKSEVDWRKLADGADIDIDGDTFGKSIPLAPRSILTGPKSICMARSSVVDPAGVSMAPVEQVMTLRSVGGCLELAVDPTGASMASVEQFMSLRSDGGCIHPVLPSKGAAAHPILQFRWSLHFLD